MDAEAERLEAASLACLDRLLTTTEAIVALLQRREAEEEAPGEGTPGRSARKRERGADASRAVGAAPVDNGSAESGRGAAYPRGRPKQSQGIGRSVFAGPAGRRHDAAPGRAASRLCDDDAAARRMLTTYVETLEAAFGSDICAAPRHHGGSAGATRALLNWLWTVPVTSASVNAAVAVAAARAARDAGADTLAGRLRRCVPVGRCFDKTPASAVIISELREHASRIGVPLPTDCGPVPATSYLRGDDAAARAMLTTYVETLEDICGRDVCAAPRNSRRNYGTSAYLLNWLWTVHAAADSAAAAGPSSARAATTDR